MQNQPKPLAARTRNIPAHSDFATITKLADDELAALLKDRKEQDTRWLGTRDGDKLKRNELTSLNFTRAAGNAGAQAARLAHALAITHGVSFETARNSLLKENGLAPGGLSDTKRVQRGMAALQRRIDTCAVFFNASLPWRTGPGGTQDMYNHVRAGRVRAYCYETDAPVGSKDAYETIHAGFGGRTSPRLLAWPGAKPAGGSCRLPGTGHAINVIHGIRTTGDAVRSDENIIEEYWHDVPLLDLRRQGFAVNVIITDGRVDLITSTCEAAQLMHAYLIKHGNEKIRMHLMGHSAGGWKALLSVAGIRGDGKMVKRFTSTRERLTDQGFLLFVLGESERAESMRQRLNGWSGRIRENADSITLMGAALYSGEARDPGTVAEILDSPLQWSVEGVGYDIHEVPATRTLRNDFQTLLIDDLRKNANLKHIRVHAHAGDCLASRDLKKSGGYGTETYLGMTDVDFAKRGVLLYREYGRSRQEHDSDSDGAVSVRGQLSGWLSAVFGEVSRNRWWLNHSGDAQNRGMWLMIGDQLRRDIWGRLRKW